MNKEKGIEEINYYVRSIRIYHHLLSFELIVEGHGISRRISYRK